MAVADKSWWMAKSFGRWMFVVEMDEWAVGDLVYFNNTQINQTTPDYRTKEGSETVWYKNLAGRGHSRWNLWSDSLDSQVGIDRQDGTVLTALQAGGMAEARRLRRGRQSSGTWVSLHRSRGTSWSLPSTVGTLLSWSCPCCYCVWRFNFWSKLPQLWWSLKTPDHIK